MQRGSYDDKNMSQKKKVNPENMKSIIRKAEGLIELLILVFSYYLIWRTYYRGTTFSYYGNGKYVLLIVYTLLVFVVFYLCDGFKYGYRKFSEVLIAQWSSLLIADVITYLQLCLIGNGMINPLPMVALFLIEVVLAFVCVLTFTQIYHRIYVPHNMVMIYGTDQAIDLMLKMNTRSDKYSITKIISYDKNFEEIRKEIADHDAVIINDVPAQIRNDILKYCYGNGIRTYVVPKVSDIIMRGAKEISIFDTPLLFVKGVGLNPTQRVVKRFFDIALCLIALIPAIPIMLVISICIKCEDHGPVFYRQERITEGDRAFHILKFRSMIVNAEQDGQAVFAAEHDDRITKVGRVIRALRLDELPQIINILKGDMSIVGPRPERPDFVGQFKEEIPEFAFRTKAKAGLTGYAQIYGKYNTSAYDKLRLDLMYIENYSILLDIKLIFMTVQTLFKKESTEGFYSRDINFVCRKMER